MEEILKELREHTGAIKAKMESSDAELKALNESIAKGALDAESMKTQMKAVADLQEELRSRLSTLEAKGNRLPNAPADANKPISLQFVEHLKSWTASRGKELTVAEAKAMPELRVDFSMEMRSTVSHTQSPIGDNDRLGRVIASPFRTPRLRDIIPVIPTSMNSVEYIEETRFNQLAAHVTSAANSGQKVIAVDNLNGFFIGQSITLSPGHANEEDAVIAALGTPTEETPGGNITVVENLTNTHAAWNPASSSDLGLVVSDEFVYTAETHLKPAAEVKLQVVQSQVKTLAHWIPVTTQMLEDESFLQEHLRMRLVEGLKLVEERQILYGDGTAQQLQGIMTHASVNGYAWSDGQVGDTRYDALRRALTLVQINQFAADAAIVHPTDWEHIELAKGEDGHYVKVTNIGPAGEPVVWTIPCLVTTAINAGDALVGAFGVGCAIRDRKTSTIKISDSHDKFFIQNKAAILAELREAFCVYLPNSFVAVDFDSAPAE